MHLVHTSTRAIYKAAKDQIKPPPRDCKATQSATLLIHHTNPRLYKYKYLFIFIFILFIYLFIYLYPPLLGPKLDGQIVRFKSALNIVKHKKEDKKNAFGISQHS